MDSLCITKEELVQDIKNSGVNSGDLLFVRISYKSIGNVEGGPKTVIDALLEVLGEDGTLVATAFPNLINGYTRFSHKDEIYEKGMPPTTGVIPVIMSKYRNAHFSSHPLAPYVAIGRLAEEITSIHTPDSGAYFIVKYMLDNYSPKCLRIGGKVFDGTTHVALSEVFVEKDAFQYRENIGLYYRDESGKILWAKRVSSAFCPDGFQDFFNKKIYPDNFAVIKESVIGNGKAMLTDMKRTYMIEKKELQLDIHALDCDSPNCVNCRSLFSYSDYGVWKYCVGQIKNSFRGEQKKQTFRNIYTCITNYWFGVKCR